MAEPISKSLLADPYRAVALIRRLLGEYARRHRKSYALAFALAGIAAACTALPVYLLKNVVNIAYEEQDLQAIVILSAVIALLFIVKGAATYGHILVLSRISNNIVAENQRRMFAKLMHESLGFHAQHHSSEFVARLTLAATSAGQVLNLLISAIGRDFLSLACLLAAMFVLDPLMTLGSLIVAPPAILLLRTMIRRIRNIAKTQFTGSTRILETMQETLQGIRIVKAFSLEDVMQARLDANVGEFERESNKMARVANRANPLMETLGGLAIAIALVYGGYRVIRTGATPGEFFAFITAFLLAYEPAKRLARLNIDLSSGLVGIRILFDILDSPATEPSDVDRPPLALTTARIEFSDVSFQYRPGEPVIRKLSFVAEPGLVTALVGPSGGGKSTMLNLILRFHEIDSGAITIDGQNIAGLSRESLRRQIAYVGQDVFLFRGSIRDNIAFGKTGASDQEIISAAQAACAHDFIMAFPRGYNTPVGEHGLQLSGGQRQRVAVARALIRDAPIILLDEATASLDPESERQVQLAIEHLCQDRTTLVIAHRLHTVTHADRIHFIEDGSIVESGRHDELLRKSGRYASFYRLQFKEQQQLPMAAIASSA
ncbi:MAG: ATP-binding cassette, subfamily bacterial MsbA [Alphaproteobacteria bacterium]|jgi:ATP-binding cassette subfamily B protein|nr:ATP-binding cassette, subfamily bacterial MsbA [Alphaproteobacteria bacterium]